MIAISKPTEQDIVGIQNVFYKTWLQTYPNKEVGIIAEDIEERFKDMLSPEALQNRKKGIQNIPENELFILAKEGERVVGLCRFIRREDKNQLQAIYVFQNIKVEV